MYFLRTSNITVFRIGNMRNSFAIRMFNSYYEQRVVLWNGGWGGYQKVLRHHDTVAGPGGSISNGFKPSSWLCFIEIQMYLGQMHQRAIAYQPKSSRCMKYPLQWTRDSGQITCLVTVLEMVSLGARKPTDTLRLNIAGIKWLGKTCKPSEVCSVATSPFAFSPFVMWPFEMSPFDMSNFASLFTGCGRLFFGYFIFNII